MKHDGQHYGSAYLRSATMRDSLRLTVNFMVAFIKKLGVDFDTIAFRGFSGGLVAPAVALALDKHLIAIRKPKSDERSHSGCCAEGNIAIQRYIIIDDFVCTGDTVREIIKGIHEAQERTRELKTPECVGIFCYAAANRDASCTVNINGKNVRLPVYSFCLDNCYKQIDQIGGCDIPPEGEYKAFRALTKRATFAKWLDSGIMQAILAKMTARATEATS